MVWGKDISWVEFIYIIVFLATYVFFYFRLRNLTSKLNSGMRAWSIKFVLRSIYLGLLITAILAPSFGVTEMEQKAAGKDIYFCVDLSKSMDASDVIPSRLEKAKSMLLASIDAMPSNRIGLVVFSSNAYVQIPLTFDSDVLKYAVQKLSTDLLPKNGTNIQSAIKVAKERMQDDSQRSKLMVLVTDGQDFGNTESLGKNNSKFKSLVLGIGTEEGYELTVGNEIMHTALDKTALFKLSNTLDAPLYILDNNEDPSKDILTYIDNMRATSFNERTVLVANNKYRYFLIPAILLIMIDIILIVKIFRI